MLTLEQVKSKSERRLIGLQPAVLAATIALIERAYSRGVPIVITQGLRTFAEQDGLYAQGRTKPGAVVTNARGGYSYHNFGLAVDFALLLPDGRQISYDMRRDGDGDKTADWMEVVQEAKALGFEWGGDWIKFKDYPHFQMDFGLSMADLRAGRKPPQAAQDAVFRKISNLQKEKEAVKVTERDINKVSDWAAETWKEATANGYFDGTRPGDQITREETAAVVNKLRANFLKLFAGNAADIQGLDKRLREIEKEAK